MRSKVATIKKRIAARVHTPNVYVGNCSIAYTVMVEIRAIINDVRQVPSVYTTVSNTVDGASKLLSACVAAHSAAIGVS